MHAWLCENPVGVDALTWKELPTPTPGPGQVLIQIEAASLNFPDLLIVQNKYQMKPELPFVPGSEYAGVVQAIGDGVTHLKVGQSVACLSGTGGFGTHTLAPAKLCMPLPAGFSAVDGAAFIMTYATSHYALMDRAALQAGETVLVLGAAGGLWLSGVLSTAQEDAAHHDQEVPDGIQVRQHLHPVRHVVHGKEQALRLHRLLQSLQANPGLDRDRARDRAAQGNRARYR